MPNTSKHFELMTAIAAVLNADVSLSTRNFKVRKKPYNRGKTWVAGGFVCPGRVIRRPHETSRNQVEYEIYVSIVNPHDADLTIGLDAHLGDIERIEEIFHGHSHDQLPATLRATSDTSGRMEISKCDSGDRLVDSAFEGGFDASSCKITITTTRARYLGAKDL